MDPPISDSDCQQREARVPGRSHSRIHVHFPDFRPIHQPGTLLIACRTDGIRLDEHKRPEIVVPDECESQAELATRHPSSMPSSTFALPSSAPIAGASFYNARSIQ